MKVYIETYGCALNKGDSYIMRSVLVKRGHSIVDNISEANVIIVNTCTVRYDTEQKMINRITSLREYCLKTGKKLIVAGCMAKAQPYLVTKIAPEASLVSPQNASRIWIAVESPQRTILLDGERDRNCVGLWLENSIAVIPIQEGCLGNCSFCIVKNARRKVVSYPIHVIINTAKNLIEKGALEIELTGQDTSVYGIDLYGKQMLPELVRRITEIKGDFMIRIGMTNPDTLRSIIDDIVDVLRHPKVYKFVHIPVQSGSNNVLKVMRRKYTVEEFIEIVNFLRRKIPGITIATDIIVGHPGETEDDFLQTIELLKKIEPERVHLAQYSVRPNTLAAKLPQIDTKTKKRRSLQVLKLIEEIGLKKNSEYIGSTARVLLVENTLPHPTARLYNYTPVIITNITKFKKGEWIKARITNATFFDLRGIKI